MGESAPGLDLGTLFDLAPVPLVLLSRRFVVVHANRRWLEAAGTAPADAVGRRVLDLPPATGPVVRLHLRALLARVLTRRRADEVTVRLPDAAPGGGWCTLAAVPVPGGDEEAAFLLLRVEELPAADGERRRRPAERARHVESALHARTQELDRARAEVRELREREHTSTRSLGGLATTVSALAAAETREDLLRQLFRHARPALAADALAVALFEPGGGQLTVVDAGDRHPARPLPLDPRLPIAAAAAGRAVYQPDAGDRPPPLPGLRAWAALPLHAGRRPLGSLTVGWRRPRPLGEEEVHVLEALAAQCAQALDRVARLETERRTAAATRSLAEVLQRSLLTDPPRVEHVDIAVRYRPAAREVQVGGDWYDAFLSPAGVLGVAVGDVTGHDRTAAALAGQMRTMLRGIVCALDGEDLARVLVTLDRALAATEAGSLATAVVARVERPAAGSADGVATFRWSNAGHPPPLLVEPDGRARLLQPPAELLLGVDAGAPRRTHAVPLRPGATVLLYTDGLVERRSATLDEGFARLLGAAAGLARSPVDRLCDEVFARLDPELTDDIALLVLRATGGPAR
jgi:serine phosphatase RsbU (regulator of sigma subunit)